MRTAFYNGKSITAQKGLKGATCKKCQVEVIPKCGPKVVHHWAHPKGCPCDPWHKNIDQTEWRDQCLNRVGLDQQDVVVQKGSESHFTDIQTSNGVNILLREKALKEELIDEIEEFFENLIWIVNLKSATQIKTFEKMFSKYLPERANKTGTFICLEPEKTFPNVWSRCKFPVIFELSPQTEESRKSLEEKTKYRYWCLMPYAKDSGIHYRAVYAYEESDIWDKLMSKKPKTKQELQDFIKQLNPVIEDQAIEEQEKIKSKESVFKKAGIR